MSRGLSNIFEVSIHVTLNPQQVAETFITTQTATYLFATYIEVLIINVIRLRVDISKPFHAQEQLLTSLSWFDQVLIYRQEIRQSHYRNDPVKYDLTAKILYLVLCCSGELDFL